VKFSAFRGQKFIQGTARPKKHYCVPSPAHCHHPSGVWDARLNFNDFTGFIVLYYKRQQIVFFTRRHRGTKINFLCGFVPLCEIILSEKTIICSRLQYGGINSGGFLVATGAITVATGAMIMVHGKS